MLRMVVGRLLFLLPAALLIIFLSFSMFYLIPGDPAVLIAGDNAPEEAIEAIREAYGLDRPLYAQFLSYVWRLLHGDFGMSIYSRVPVLQLLIPCYLNTLRLVGLAMAFGVTIGLAMGCVASSYQGRGFDRLITSVSLTGICTPVFLSALAAMYLFCVRMRLLPVGGSSTWKAYVLPVVTFGLFQAAFFTRMVRSCMIESIAKDYIRTARAKGLGSTKIVLKHALRNSLIPLITILGVRLGYAIGGAVVTETIFTWPGIARLMVGSVGSRDLPVVQGSLLLIGATLIMINLAVDIAYAIADPRIEY